MLSEKMSDLDFEAKYEDTPHTTEELSRLGHSMNVLSERLKEAIGEPVSYTHLFLYKIFCVKAEVLENADGCLW